LLIAEVENDVCTCYLEILVANILSFLILCQLQMFSLCCYSGFCKSEQGLICKCT